MKKDIRIFLIILATIVSSFIGSGFANATLFPISTSAPTDGVTMDNDQLCSIACINNDPKGVRQYIDAFPAKSADKFFNANWQTQQAIIAAYNKDAHTTYTNAQAQVLMSGYLSGAISGSGYIPGISGQVTYKGETFYITNGTFTLHWIDNSGLHHYDIGIIDKELNYRFASNTRGNLRTTTGVTWAYIDGVIIDLNSAIPVINSFVANPSAILPGQSSVISWGSNNADTCVITNNADNTDVSRSATGTMTVSPTSTTKYTIVCSKGSLKSTPSILTINVGTIVPSPPIITSFSATPSSITTGQSSTLLWTSTNANICTITGIAADQGANGSLSVYPTSTTKYTIVCSKGGYNSAPRDVTVTVDGIISSGSIINPYAHFLSVVTVNKLNTWITNNIVVRSTTLTPANYSNFIDSVITALFRIRTQTLTSNKNKRNMINYLIFELQRIQDSIDQDDSFLDGIL